MIGTSWPKLARSGILLLNALQPEKEGLEALQQGPGEAVLSGPRAPTRPHLLPQQERIRFLVTSGQQFQSCVSQRGCAVSWRDRG